MVQEPILDADNAAFVQSGASIIAASRDTGNAPTLVRAVGCRVSADRRRISVFVAPFQCPTLLQDVRTTRAIAVVFSQPSTHRTLQLKGTDAAIERLQPGDQALIARQADAFADDIARHGYARPLAHTLVAAETDELVAVSFTPSAAYVQTPGPRAGAPLRS